jgi:predicted dehydrogenase
VHGCEFAPTEGTADLRYRVAEPWAPALATTEPLRAMVEHFVECIAGDRRPITDGAAGLRVVRVLEAAAQSLRAGGRIVALTPEGVPA